MTISEKLRIARLTGDLNDALMELADAVSESLYVADSQLYREDITHELNEAYSNILKARTLLNQDLEIMGKIIDRHKKGAAK